MPRVIVPVTDITPPKALLTTALSGTHNDLTFTARQGGPSGNSIRIIYVVAGNNTLLSISVAGWDITVNVATSGAGAATSTASQVLAALTASVDAMRLVSVALAAANDGTGVVTALSATNLAGGSLATTPPSQVNGDSANGHYITGNDGQVFLEVVSSDGGAQTVGIDYSPFYAPITDIASESVSIAAGVTRLLGPFPTPAFSQNGTNDLYFTSSVNTNLKFRAYRIPFGLGL